MKDKSCEAVRRRAQELARMEPRALLAYVAALLEFQAFGRTIADGDPPAVPGRGKAMNKLEKMARGDSIRARGGVRYLGDDPDGNRCFEVDSGDELYHVRVRLDRDRLVMADCECEDFQSAAGVVEYANAKMIDDPSKRVWVVDGLPMCEHVWAVLTEMRSHEDEAGSTWMAKPGP